MFFVITPKPSRPTLGLRDSFRKKNPASKEDLIQSPKPVLSVSKVVETTKDWKIRESDSLRVKKVTRKYGVGEGISLLLV